MNKFIKNNFLIIISLLILIVIFLIGLANFMKSFNNNKKFISDSYNECILNNGIEDCQELEQELNSYKVPPAPLLFIYIIASGDPNLGPIQYLQLLSILFVFIPGIYYFYVDVKSGIYKFKFTRENSFSFFRKHYLSSMKSILILPLFIIICFFITCIVSNFKFQYLPGEIEYEGFFWTQKEYARSLWLPYLSLMIFSVLCHSIYYINTAYLMFYKTKNFIVNSVATYLSYLITQITIINFLSMILSRVLKLSELAIALSDPEIWVFGSEISNFEWMIVSSIFYVLISTLFVAILYYKKERFVMIND